MIDLLGMPWQTYIKLSHNEQAKVLFKLGKQDLLALYYFFDFFSDSVENGELINAALSRITLALG